MKSKIGPSTYLRLAYSISIMDIIIALSHRNLKLRTEYSAEPLRAIIKVTSRRILEVIDMFIDIFVVILKENDFFLW